MTNKECIDRWAEYIIPAVFKAEDALKKAKPEWMERLDKLWQPGGEDPHKVAKELMKNKSLDIKKKVCCQGFGPGKWLTGKPIWQKCLINANN